MQLAPIPEDEEARLQALQSYEILDTVSEIEYDDIVKLATIICDTPIGLVSLVDQDRQWFKSKIGIEATETPRDISFCGHAILKPNELFLVEDTMQDKRFSDNPLVVEGIKIRFYAGIPLVSEEKQALGTLCVIDDKPHQMTESQKLALKTLGSNVVHLLSLRKKLIQVEEEQEAKAKLFDKLVQTNRELEGYSKAAVEDLQDPLQKIGVSIFSLNRENRFGEKSVQDMETIHNSLHYVKNLLDNMQALQNFNKQDMRYEIVDMNKLIRNISTSFQENSKNDKVHISFGNLPKIYSHLSSITGIFHHLIGNSIKFQPKGKIAEVQVSAERDGEHWEFSVIDNGIGIETKHHNEIFKPFKALHKKEEYAGSGLGLAIVKKSLEYLGGDIYLESELNKGSKFTVRVSARIDATGQPPLQKTA